MAANTGRTSKKWIRFLIHDSGATLREIPIMDLTLMGIEYEEIDLTAFQDAVKGALLDMPDAPIEWVSPFDTIAAQAAAGSGAAPALSGSHTVLEPLNGLLVPLTIDIRFGIRHYWETGEPQFGITATATSGYILQRYKPNPADGTVECRAVLFPGSALPAWGTTAES